MRVCQSCGKNISEFSNACPYCGVGQSAHNQGAIVQADKSQDPATLDHGRLSKYKRGSVVLAVICLLVALGDIIIHIILSNGYDLISLIGLFSQVFLCVVLFTNKKNMWLFLSLGFYCAIGIFLNLQDFFVGLNYGSFYSTKLFTLIPVIANILLFATLFYGVESGRKANKILCCVPCALLAFDTLLWLLNMPLKYFWLGIPSVLLCVEYFLLPRWALWSPASQTTSQTTSR